MRNIRPLVGAVFAGAVIMACVSCSSMTQVAHNSGGAENTRPAAAQRDARSETGLRPAGGGSIVEEDLGRTDSRAARLPGRRTAADTAGVEDNTPFRDLPDIKIDERSLGKATTVGHDALILKELKRLLREFGEKDNEVETVFLNEVKLYVKAFQTNEQYRRFMNNSLRRSARYMPAVKEVFRKRNIPEDMAFIAFLESGFNPGARSHAGAVGMWQFMSGTAKRYSLKVNDRVDDRLDPVKSTYAAVEYFHDLIAIFGPRSFLLALAAYNCGEGRIISCLKKIDNPMEERTFWHIRTCLAPETREYPPKIIASAVIGSNPEVFGFPRYDGGEESLEIKTAFADYRSIEETAGETRPVPRPQIRNKDAGNAGNTKAAKAKVARAAKPAEPKPVVYVVKKNNNLAVVAEMFKVEQGDIKKWNRMKDNRVMAGQKLKIYPPVNLDMVSYKVKKGDTITEICQNLKVRPRDVIAGNGLKNGLSIKQGQLLVVYKTSPRKTGGSVAGHRERRGAAGGSRV